MYIVSPNYQDRNSKKRWFIREKEEGSEKAKAFSSVEANNVQFIDSTTIEWGFGCFVVAEAKIASGDQETDNEIIEGEVELYYRDHWIRTKDGNRVESCVSFRLTQNGHMFATLKKAKAKKQKKPQRT